MKKGSINLGSPVNWASPLNQSLVSWWLPLANNQGGGTLFDLCGRSHGTLTSMDPATDWVPGRSGFHALDFDGAGGDRIVVADSTSLAFGTGDFSVGGWFYLRTLGVLNGEGRELITKALASGTFAGWSLRQIVSTDINHWSFWPYNSGGSEVVSSVTPVANTWVHIFGVRRGGTAYIYVNGVQTGSAASTADVSNNVELWISGNNTGWIGTELDGLATDCRVYNRGLSDAEVQQLYYDSFTGYRQTLRRVIVPAIGTAAATFTATASVTVSTVTCSGSASHTAPTYTASAAVTVSNATAQGAASHTPPTFHGCGGSYGFHSHGQRQCNICDNGICRHCRGDRVHCHGERYGSPHAADVRNECRRDRLDGDRQRQCAVRIGSVYSDGSSLGDYGHGQRHGIVYGAGRTQWKRRSDRQHGNRSRRRPLCI